MKLKSFISNECCNYIRNECVGVGFTAMFSIDSICNVLLKKDPEPCDFFKNAVLPLAEHKGFYTSINNEYSRIDKTVKLYKKRLCECGAKLDKGAKFCNKCKRDRVKKSNRKSYKKKKG